MAKTIIEIGKCKQLLKFNLTTWPLASALTLDELSIREDDLNKKQVNKTRVIGFTPDGRVLHRTVSETNRG